MTILDGQFNLTGKTVVFLAKSVAIWVRFKIDDADAIARFYCFPSVGSSVSGLMSLNSTGQSLCRPWQQNIEESPVMSAALLVPAQPRLAPSRR